MAQLSPAGGYILTGPDGTRAVFNAPTDPDFVGYLDPTNGITGLLDTAQVRESFVNIVEGDGATQGNQYFSRRVGTITFSIVNWANMAHEQLIESKVKRASRGMRLSGPCTLTWTPDGQATRMMFLYRQDVMQFTGRIPKQVVLPMSSPYPYTYSAALHQQDLPYGAGVGDLGFTSGVTDPLTTAFDTIATSNIVVNEGDAETWPLIILSGPMLNPQLLNNSTGKSFTLNISLLTGQQLAIDTNKRTIFLQGPNYLATNYSNGISNPGFEYDTVGSAPIWWAGSGLSTNLVDSTWSSDGTQSNHITATVAASGTASFSSPSSTGAAIPVNPLSYYSATAIVNLLASPTDCGAILQITWRDSGGTDLGTYPQTSTPLSTPGIYPLEVTALAPSSAAYAEVSILLANGDASSHVIDAYVDSFSFSPGSTPTFVTGDSIGYWWAGVHGDSWTVQVLSYAQQDMYSVYAANFIINSWWSLQPGSNDIRLLGTSIASPATAIIQWRDAYE